MTSVAQNPQGLDVRRLAVDLFRNCLDRKLTVEDAVDGSAKTATLEPRDRALLMTLLLTTFRHKGEIDAILASLLSKPLPRKSGKAGDILTLGTTQLLYLGMPPHAVIDLSVRAAKADRYALHFAGLVNAVLRKVSAGGEALLNGSNAARLNTPPWLWERWSKNYGSVTADQIANAHAGRPALDLSFKEDPKPWLEPLGAELLPNGQVRLPSEHAPVPELPGFAEGAWWVQDAAAAIPVSLMGDIRGKSVLDLCAAPGGKTLQLAALGAKVTAVDVSEPRLRRLRDNLARTKLDAEILAQDVFSVETADHWDAVLLDAPCSATGTIRRHPELPHLKDEAQVRELTGVQRRMLKKAARLVKPGGVLVYCTCSLEPEEGEEQLQNFLERNEDFEIIPPAAEGLPLGSLHAEGWVRTLPFMTFGRQTGVDGFFAVAMRRRV